MFFAGGIGTAIEWYDFALYGFLAPVIATQFFPAESRATSLLATFAIFAVAYLMRPIGGLLFGHLGDKFGRKLTLIITVSLIALPTALIAALPTYDYAKEHWGRGWLAPVFLMLCRALQGLSMGGDFTGSATLLAEYAPKNRRAFFSCVMYIAAGVGTIVASLFVTILALTLTHEQLASWGWRVPFIGALVIGLLGIWLRLKAPESPEFEKNKKAHQLVAIPFIEVMRSHKKAIFIVLGIVFFQAVGLYIPFVYTPTWLKEYLHFSFAQALAISTIGNLVMISLIPVAALLSDRIGRRPVLLISTLGTAIVSIPLYYWMISSGRPEAHSITNSFIVCLASIIIIGVLGSCLQGTLPAALVESFPTNIRYSAVAFSYNLGAGVFGGTAPFVATYLVHNAHNLGLSSSETTLQMPGYYLALAGVVASLVIFFSLKETFRTPLH